MKANIQLDDWANNIFVAMVYSSLGCRDEAEECVMCNIDFGFESEVSGRLLARMELDELPQKSEVIHDDTKVESPNERTDDFDSEKKYQLGKSYIQRANTIEKCSLIMFLSAWVVLGFTVFSFMITDSFLLNVFVLAVVIALAFIGIVRSAGKMKEFVDGFTSKYIKAGRDLYTESAENGNINAMYALGKWCENEKAEDESIRWLRKAALYGHVEAQRLLSEIYSRHNDNSEAYMWAYLAYLCSDTNEPDPENYRLSGFNLMAS